MSPGRLAAEWLEVRVTVAAEAGEAVGEELRRQSDRKSVV